MLSAKFYKIGRYFKCFTLILDFNDERSCFVMNWNTQWKTGYEITTKCMCVCVSHVMCENCVSVYNTLIFKVLCYVEI